MTQGKDSNSDRITHYLRPSGIGGGSMVPRDA